MPKRGILGFSTKNLLSHSTENIVGEPFFISQIFWYRKKFTDKKVEGVSQFSDKSFLSHSNNYLCAEYTSQTLIKFDWRNPHLYHVPQEF